MLNKRTLHDTEKSDIEEHADPDAGWMTHGRGVAKQASARDTLESSLRGCRVRAGAVR